MITAKEAFKKSQLGYENYMNHLKEIVKNELENYITEKIELAINRGAFSTEYWWSVGWFEDQAIFLDDFLTCLEKELEFFGYKTFTSQNEECGIIWIDWDQEEEG